MVDPQLSITVEHQDGGVVVLRVSGELDLLSAEPLGEALRSVNGTVLVDLAAVSFIDGQGVNTLCAAQEHVASRGNQLAVINPTPRTRRVLQICGVESLLGLGSDAP
jgi:anti-sigma B factor antagonist